MMMFRLADISGQSHEELLAKVDTNLEIEGIVTAFTVDAATGIRLAVVRVPGIECPLYVPISPADAG